MGRRWQGNSSPQKTNNLIGDLMGNEEKKYPVSGSKRTMINMTDELNDMHKNF
jgi:hypothetical protein